MKHGNYALGCALGIALFSSAAAANVTAVYGCRFYVDGKVYAEFRINELDHTGWAERGLFNPPEGKPIEVEVKAEGSPGEPNALTFSVPEREIEIRVANTLNYVNARYTGPVMKDLPGECEQADSRNALNRWFAERERDRKRHAP